LKALYLLVLYYKILLLRREQYWVLKRHAVRSNKFVSPIESVVTLYEMADMWWLLLGL
jgi:hypothetical protein